MGGQFGINCSCPFLKISAFSEITMIYPINCQSHQTNKHFLLKLISFNSGVITNQWAGNYKTAGNYKVTPFTLQCSLQSTVWLVLVITCLGGKFGINCSSAFFKVLKFQNVQKSRGWFIPKIAETKHVITC